MKKKSPSSNRKPLKKSYIKSQDVDSVDDSLKARKPIAIRSVRDGQRLLRRLFFLRQKGEIDSLYVSDMCKLLDRLILLGKELEFSDELKKLQEQINANDNAEKPIIQTNENGEFQGESCESIANSD